MFDFAFLNTKLCITATLGLFATQVAAQDSSKLLIMKIDGQPPTVEADSVDLVGATQLYKLLGEDYLVMSNSVTFDPAREPVPIKLPPGTKPPIAPICQCPEGYITALETRFSNIEVNPLLQSRTMAGFDEAKPVEQFGADKTLMLEKFRLPGAKPTIGVK